MKIIQMSIVGQSIYVEAIPDIISDCERYLAISCSFNSEWDGFVKTAVFKSGDIVKHVLFHPENELFYAGDNLYYVPSEVIRANGFTVAVIGTKEDVVLTTSVEFVAVGQSGYAEESAEKEKSEYLYAQVLSVLETIQRKMLSSEDVNLQITDGHLQLTANGEAVGEGAELPKITVDSELSADSENPVQNKAVAAALSKKADAVQYFEYAVSFLGNMGFSARFDRNTVVYKVDFGYWRDGKWNPYADIPCPKTEGTPDTGLKILSAPVPSLVSVRMPDVETDAPENQWTPLSLFSTELGIPIEIRIEQNVNTGGYRTLTYLIRIDFNEAAAEAPDEVWEMGNYLLGIDRIRIAWEDFFEPVVYE